MFVIEHSVSARLRILCKHVNKANAFVIVGSGGSCTVLGATIQSQVKPAYFIPEQDFKTIVLRNSQNMFDPP